MSSNQNNAVLFFTAVAQWHVSLQKKKRMLKTLGDAYRKKS